MRFVAWEGPFQTSHHTTGPTGLGTQCSHISNRRGQKSTLSLSELHLPLLCIHDTLSILGSLMSWGKEIQVSLSQFHVLTFQVRHSVCWGTPSSVQKPDEGASSVAATSDSASWEVVAAMSDWVMRSGCLSQGTCVPSSSYKSDQGPTSESSSCPHCSPALVPTWQMWESNRLAAEEVPAVVGSVTATPVSGYRVMWVRSLGLTVEDRIRKVKRQRWSELFFSHDFLTVCGGGEGDRP